MKRQNSEKALNLAKEKHDIEWDNKCLKKIVEHKTKIGERIKEGKKTFFDEAAGSS